MTLNLTNTGSLIRWGATALGIQTKLFIYSPEDRFLLSTTFDLGSKTLQDMWEEHQKRLDQCDTLLPPWSD